MNLITNKAKVLLERFHPMPQNAVSIQIPIVPSKEKALRSTLDEINSNAADNRIIPFAQFDSVHFARFIILEGIDDEKNYGTTLVFMANIDGPISTFVDQLANKCPKGIDKIFKSCTAYPAAAHRSRSSRREFLLAHSLDTQAFYVNTIGRTALQIRQQSELQESLQVFLNSLDQDTIESAKLLRETVIEFVTEQPELSWAIAKQAQPSLLWRSIENVRFTALLAFGLLILLWAWPVLVSWALTLRVKEFSDEEDTKRPDLNYLKQLRASEDIAAHNPFAAIGYLKSGWLRKTTASSLLVAAQVVLRHVFNKGDLAGVPALGLDGVDTIHFARWTMLDDRKRLLFTSNYDGSLESYMVDFIDKVSWGLNLIFSNGKGYPKTKWIVKDGARKEQRFKDYLGNHQIENQVWYTAYPHLTANNISNNEAIQNGLRGHMSERSARSWLKRF